MCDLNSDSFSPEDHDADAFEYISLSGVSEGMILRSEETPTEDAPSRAKRKTRTGDVLVGTVRPKQRSHGFVMEEHDGKVCSTGFGVLRSGPNIHPSYLSQEILAHRFFRQMEAYVAGSGYPAVKLSDLRKHRIAVPPLEEQRKIASVLYNVDRAIQKTDDIIERTDRIKRGVAQDLLADGFNASGRKDIRLSAVDVTIPEHWDVVSVADVSKRITDGAHLTPDRSDEGHLLLSARNIKDSYIDLSDVDYVPKDEYQRLIQKCHPEPGDVLISCSGTVGRVCLVPDDLKFALVRSTALIKLNDSLIPEFTEQLLQSSFVQKQITGYQTQSAQPNLFQGQIASIEIPLPPVSEQHDIARMLSKFDEHRKIENDYRSELRQFKRGLMQDLLSGEVRTADADIEILDEVLEHG